jgi:hypothetical protein
MKASPELSLVMAHLHSHPSEHGNPVERLDLKNITKPNKHLKEFPSMSFLKAAEIRNMIPGVLECARHWSDGSDTSVHQILMMEGLADLYATIHAGAMKLTPIEVTTLQTACQKFLMEYTWLANQAMRLDKSMYSVKPKHHYLVHLCEQAAVVNPRFTWCYGGEDMVGKISRLAHVCLYGTPNFKVASSLAEKYRVAMHLRLARQ